GTPRAGDASAPRVSGGKGAGALGVMGSPTLGGQAADAMAAVTAALETAASPAPAPAAVTLEAPATAAAAGATPAPISPRPLLSRLALVGSSVAGYLGQGGAAATPMLTAAAGEAGNANKASPAAAVETAAAAAAAEAEVAEAAAAAAVTSAAAAAERLYILHAPFRDWDLDARGLLHFVVRAASGATHELRAEGIEELFAWVVALRDAADWARSIVAVGRVAAAAGLSNGIGGG
ncbi:unnamed protein product, partial [Phaeothamnion confervicola]